MCVLFKELNYVYNRMVLFYFHSKCVMYFDSDFHLSESATNQHWLSPSVHVMTLVTFLTMLTLLDHYEFSDVTNKVKSDVCQVRRSNLRSQGLLSHFYFF